MDCVIGDRVNENKHMCRESENENEMKLGEWKLVTLLKMCESQCAH